MDISPILWLVGALHSASYEQNDDLTRVFFSCLYLLQSSQLISPSGQVQKKKKRKNLGESLQLS